VLDLKMSLSRLSGLNRGVSRLLGLARSGCQVAVEDAIGTAATPLIDPPCTPYTMIRRTRTFTSAAVHFGDSSDKQEADQRATKVIFDIGGEEAEHIKLNLPTDLSEIQKLNPDLADVMEASAAFTRYGTTLDVGIIPFHVSLPILSYSCLF